MQNKTVKFRPSLVIKRRPVVQEYLQTKSATSIVASAKKTKYNAMQCNALQGNAMQCNALQGNAMHCKAMQCMH